MARSNSEIVRDICDRISYHDEKLPYTFLHCPGCPVCNEIFKLGIEGSGGMGRQNRSTKRYFMYREKKLVAIYETKKQLLIALGFKGNENPVSLDYVRHNGLVVRTSDEESNVFVIAMRNIKYHKYIKDLKWSDIPGNNHTNKPNVGYLPTVRVLKQMKKLFGLNSYLDIYDGLEFDWSHEACEIEFERGKK